MNDEKLWFAVLTVRTGQDGDGGAQALSMIGYRGLTWHSTREDAEAEARRMLDAAVGVDRMVRWMAIWAKPWMSHRGHDAESGSCYSALHEPDAS